ncbi:MAG: ribbon-helix-helix domain-containing protein [Hassallia sp. WJT32-NPBG1]|jgi:predicted DNA-binding protein|nr:ribbon-helix-helix domain-containing protein [Hassallia sp. WJT32-NPBG1]
MEEVSLNVRLPKDEMKILESYAKRTKRTKTDLVREWIRSFENISYGT